MHIHLAGPVEGLIPVAQPGTTAALSWNSGSNTLILSLAELLLLVWLLVRWLVRRQGGRRRAWRLLSRQARLTLQAFSEPVREFLRFRAAVRQLTRLLTSGVPAAIAHDALDDVDTAVGRTAAQAFGFAATIRPGTRRDDGAVAVHVAGRGVPPSTHPWRTDGDPLVWHASVVDVRRRAAQAAPAEQETGEPLARPRVLVPLGLSDHGVVFIDLLRGPRILSTYGERRATRSFVQAVAAYLDLPGGEAEVMVTRGVHPRFDGPDLDSLLASLTGQSIERTRPVVVVCAAPDDEQSARLSRMATAGLLCAVVVGPTSAHRWEVRVNSRGRTETPGLGIETNAGPLGPAVARAARRSRAHEKNRARVQGGSARPTKPQPPAVTRPRHPVPVPVVSGSQPPASVASEPTPVGPPPAARSHSASGQAHRGAPAGHPTASADRRTTAAGHPRADGRTAPAAAPPPASEPLDPAIRDLFAEPESTGISAVGTPDAESFETPRDERHNGS